MAIQNHTAPYELNLNTVDGQIVPIAINNESRVVYDAQIPLAQIPDEFYRVVISGKAEISLRSKIENTNQFKVDYKNAIVYLHPDLEGQSVTIDTYYGKGIKLLFASRVKIEDLAGNWTSTNLESLVGEIKTYIDNHKTNLQNQITSNDEDIVNLQSQINNNDNDITDLQNQIDSNDNDITQLQDDTATNKENHESHLNSEIAHENDSIVNRSNVAGAKSSDALNELKILVQAVNDRIDELTTNQDLNPDKDSELLDARNSVLYGAFTTLVDRLEAIETREKYFFKEEHTVLEGNNSITLANIPENEHELLIYDTTFGCVWEEENHWNRVGQEITFTSEMPKDLTFRIYNIG